MDYKNIARNFDQYVTHTQSLWLLGYPALVNLLAPVEGKQGLDYGCGSGLMCRYLQSLGAVMTGVDISEEMIRVARDNGGEGLSFHHIRSGKVDLFPDSSMDFALSLFVLCEIGSQKEILSIMKEIYRILKPGGHYLIMNANWDRSNGREFISYKLEYNPDLVSGCRIKAILKSDPPMIIEDFYWPKDEYLDLLQRAGFGIETIEEPISRGDSPGLLDEKTHPPFLIILAKK